MGVANKTAGGPYFFNVSRERQRLPLVPSGPLSCLLLLLLGAPVWQGICSWGTLNGCGSRAVLRPIAYRLSTPSGGVGCSHRQKARLGVALGTSYVLSPINPLRRGWL
jgi:hypothetical protein